MPLRPLMPLLCLLALACRGGEPESPRPDAAEPAASATDTTAEATPAGLPNRTEELERDAGSRPQEVMDFVGIGEGDEVADIFAGSGYYTYLLSERVGPQGRVYAQGYSPGLRARLENGDLARAGNVVLVDSLNELPSGQLDAALIIRGYHLFDDPAALFRELQRALKPGGTVGVVEVRLGAQYGHDMETHRMGEQTVIDQFQQGGFEFLATSSALRNPEDDHTGFWEGRRHLADRMLLKFARPGEPAPATPPTARRSP